MWSSWRREHTSKRTCEATGLSPCLKHIKWGVFFKG
jgi:hypothetical protein